MNLIHTCPKCNKDHEMNCTPEPSQMCPECKEKSRPRLSINPPPIDRKCECCGKHISELKPYGKTGDPLNTDDYDGAILVKTYRTMAQQIKEYDNILELVENWDKLFEFNNKLADQLSFYSQLVGTVSSSWECRDCIILGTKEYFDVMYARRDNQVGSGLNIEQQKGEKENEKEKNNAN